MARMKKRMSRRGRLMWANVPAAVLGGSNNNGEADEGPCRVPRYMPRRHRGVTRHGQHPDCREDFRYSVEGGGCVKSAKKSCVCLTRISRAISRASNANPTHIQRTSNAVLTQIQRTSKRTSNAVLTHLPAGLTHIHQPREIPTYISSRWLCAPLRIPDWWCHVRVSAVLGLCISY